MPNADTTRMLVCQTRCAHCLFGPSPLVSPARKADLIRQARRADSHFICHLASFAGRNVCCRGFWDRYKHDALELRLAQVLDIVTFVSPGPEVPHG